MTTETAKIALLAVALLLATIGPRARGGDAASLLGTTSAHYV